MASNVNHAEVFRRYIPGNWPPKNPHGDIQVSCPFHKDESPSFSFNPDTGVWSCFSCDRCGNSTTFVAQKEGIDNSEAYKMICGWQGLKAEKKSKEQEPETLDSYAESKNLNKELLKSLGISTTKHTGVECLRIPYYDANGVQAATRFRFGKDSRIRFKWAQGDKPILYGLWLWAKKQKQKVILVEGESDCHAIWQSGLPAYGVPGATNFKPEFVDDLTSFESVYIHVEPDKGGKIFLEQVSLALKKKGYNGGVFSFSVNSLYPECKDPSDLFRDKGEDFRQALVESLKNAEKVELSQIEETKTTEKPEEEKHKFHSFQSYKASDIENENIDIPTPAVAWMCPVGTSMLYAQPKKGKSFLAMQACIAVCRGEQILGMPTNKGSCLYLDLESSKAREKSRLSRMLAGSPFPDTLYITHASDTIKTGLIDAISEAQERIDREDPQNPLRLVVIDTLAFVKDSSTGNDNAYEADTKILKPLQQFSHKAGLSILLIHHAKKGASGSDIIEGHSGSMGISGIVDCTCRLDGDRHAEMTLQVQPRDADEYELMIRADPVTSNFTLITGASEEYLKRKAHDSNPITPIIRAAMRGLNHWEGSPGELYDWLSEKIGMPASITPNGFFKSLRTEAENFKDMDGLIIYCGRTKSRRTVRINRANAGQVAMADMAQPVDDLTPFDAEKVDDDDDFIF